MSTTRNQQNKRTVWDFWQALDDVEPTQIASVTHAVMDPNVVWHGPDPINQLHGVESFIADFWLPLRHSFPNLKRQAHLFCGGKSNGRIDGDISRDGKMWVSGTGYLTGTFAHDYLTIPAIASCWQLRAPAD